MKKILNKKILLGVSALLIAICVIAICSFVPFIIDPTQWQTQKFLTNELITIGIVIFGMMSAFVIGQAGNGQNPNSNICKARNDFINSVKLIDNYNYFSQWIVLILQKKDTEEIKQRELRKVGIQDKSYLDLDNKQIKDLLDKPQKYNDRLYKGLTKEQVIQLLNIKKGKYNVDFVSPNYYLSVKNVDSSKTSSEMASNENKKKGLLLGWQIISKLIITVVVAMIFASLIRDTTQAVDKGEAWLNFVSRMFSLITSAFYGYVVGCKMNDLDSEYIRNRIIVHTRYLQDKDFKPLSDEEYLKELYFKDNE